MKNCPFCKKIVAKNNDICPHCKRVLVERFNSVSPHNPNTAYESINTSTINSLKNFFKQLRIKLHKKLKWNDFKKYALIFAFLLFIFISFTKGNNDTSDVPVSVLPTNIKDLTISPTIRLKNPKDYVSLANGTILSKSTYYFEGLGQLKIDNGTSLDAIAKLVNVTTNKSIITVYIKANSVYTINDISNNSYKLFFNLGSDWDGNVKAFSVNSGYEVFEENFDFTTSEYNDGTQYSTFRVTLNPVVNGKAKTNEINAVEFGSY